jgi:DNA topoisomerase IA
LYDLIWKERWLRKWVMQLERTNVKLKQSREIFTASGEVLLLKVSWKCIWKVMMTMKKNKKECCLQWKSTNYKIITLLQQRDILDAAARYTEASLVKKLEELELVVLLLMHNNF